MQKSELDKIYDKDSSYYAGARPEMQSYFPDKSKTMLEVGCGEGEFGYSIKKRFDAEVWGVDICEDAITTAQERLDKAFCADVANNLDVLPDDYFDAIFFNDVLEHLIDPYTLLDRIKTKLSKDGVVIASIPNIRHFRVLYQILFKKDFKYQSAGVMDKTHLRFFTAKSMCRMFEEAGYVITELVPINKSKSIKPILFKIFTLGLIGSDISYLQYVVIGRK